MKQDSVISIDRVQEGIVVDGLIDLLRTGDGIAYDCGATTMMQFILQFLDDRGYIDG